jgi:hypothetical protein
VFSKNQDTFDLLILEICKISFYKILKKYKEKPEIGTFFSTFSKKSFFLRKFKEKSEQKNWLLGANFCKILGKCG